MEEGCVSARRHARVMVTSAFCGPLSRGCSPLQAGTYSQREPKGVIGMSLHRGVRSLSLAAQCGILVLSAACGGDDTPTQVTPPADIAHGLTAFVASCSTCHATRDAFDLAHFGFASTDIVRRALKHVDLQTANDIAAYVKSLGVRRVGRDTRPFQPGTQVLANDQAFWVATFGTKDWPANLTPAALRSINTRALDVPLVLPQWSSESDDTDWLPEVPLTNELLNASSGELAAAIERYYAASTTANLLSAIASFERANSATIASVCYGEAGTHPRARECFEARRWMSTLAAQHFLRQGAGSIPIEVADLWWSTGQAAVTVYQRERGHPASMVWGWLYLAYSFAPTRFNEDNAYLGQFLQADGMLHLAAFTALRRMVDTAQVHRALPAQRFWDASLAILRAPHAVQGSIAEFSYAYLLNWMNTGAVLDSAARKSAEGFVNHAHEQLLRASIQQDQLARITSLRDQLLVRLR